MRRLSVWRVCCWLVCCVWISCLYAETVSEYEGASEVTATEGLPSSFVKGSVCAISGEFTHSVIDIVMPGPEPLAMIRHYGNFSRGNFDAYWSCNHAGHMLLGDAVYKNKEVLIIGVRQQSCAQLDYQHPKVKHILKNKQVPFEFVVPKGFTNGASRFSGQTSIKNQQVIYYPKAEETIVTDGAGNRRTFSFLERTEEGWSLFAQQKEEKVNHALYTYAFDKKTKRPSKIAVQHSLTELFYSDLHFDRYLEDLRIKLTASDHRKVNYHFLKHHFKIKNKDRYERTETSIDQAYLKSVESDFTPHETYEYKEKATSKELNLVAIKRAGQLVTEIEYYHEGANHLNGKIGTIQVDKKDPRLDRVKKLKAPVGTDGTLITTHRFDYHCHTKEDKERKELVEGYTNVYDAHDCRTRYDYDAQHRIRGITRYKKETKDSKEHHYSKEKFIWGTGRDEGNLKGKIFQDSHSHPYYARYFEYDEHGNVIQSALYGKLTGLPTVELELGENQYPLKNGCEVEYKVYSYSEDGLNLLKSETDSNGTIVEYDYVAGTNYLKAKRTIYEGQIQLREFYVYDQDDMLIQKIRDDGHATEQGDLTGVTERYIIYITPRKNAPVGLPEEIKECYLDAGQEKLLNRVVLHYTPYGLLAKKDVYDANNQWAYDLTWEYDAHGNVIEETDALGNAIKKKYDKHDNLTYQKASYADFHLEYTYDFANRLICQKEVHDNGQRFATKHTYNHLGQCEVTTNPYGHETHQTFDEFGRVQTVLYPPIVTLVGDKKESVYPVTAKAYDIAGYPICITDAKGEKTQMEYNIHGKPVKITYPDGTSECFIYRLDGHLMHKVAKDGSALLYKRDPQGRITEENYYDSDGGKPCKTIQHVYNALHLQHSTNAAGSTTTYRYDSAGRLEWTMQENRRIQYLYDALGRIHEEREWFGDQPHEYRSKIKDYDLLDRLTDEKLQTSDGLLLEFAHYEYDAYGNRILEQKGEQITRTTYNAHKQPTSITNGLNQTTRIEYDTNFIDPYGQRVLQTKTTDPLGYQTIDTYDTANRLVETKRCDPFGVCVSCQNQFYDLCGNVCCTQNHIVREGKIQSTIETHFKYSKTHQIETLIEAVNTPKQKITRTFYNLFGQKSQVIKPDGMTLDYTYDTLGRLKSLKSSDGSIAYAYTYDVCDQVREVLDERTGQSTKRDYDLLGQLTMETLGHGLAMQYTYDPVGRVRHVTLPDQTQVDYQYDAVHLKSIQRLKAGTSAYTYHKTAYNLSGQATKVQLPGENGYLDAQYDVLGRCISLQSTAFQQHIPANEGYDKAGNLRELQTQGVTYTFDYDDLYQVKEETGHVHHAYGFDSLSNRVKKDGEEHTYNELHQLERKGQEKYRYDLNGNLIRHIKEGKKTEYIYDALDRLLAVIKEDKTVATYQYDAFHRRLSTMRPEHEPHYFVYQGQEEIGCWVQGEFQELRLIDHTRRSPLLAIELKHKLYVPLHDLSGNVTCLLDEQGQVVERYRYTAFGESEILTLEGQLIPHSLVGNPWQYAGKRLDQETGFIAFGLRYYDPQLGRWITPDPAGLADGPNLYAYVHNSPMRYHDSFGLTAMAWATHGISQAGANNKPMGFSLFGLLGNWFQNQNVQFFSFEKFLVAHRSFEDHYNTFELEDDLGHNAWNFEYSGVYNVNEMNLMNPDTHTPYHFPETPGLLFTSTNGIMNNYQTCQENVLHMAKLANHNVTTVHAASYGLGWDLTLAAAGRCGIASEATQSLLETWNNFFDACPNGYVCHTTHSRGAIYTRNALLSYPPHLRERISVVAIAPAAFIEKRLCERVIHFVSRDIVPFTDPIGMIRNWDTIRFISPSPSASWLDHNSISDTYIPGLQEFYQNCEMEHR